MTSTHHGTEHNENEFMGRLINIGISSLLSGGILSHGTLSGYVSDAARRALGMGLAHFKDGTVHYLGKDVDLLVVHGHQ